jgi:hypothetical protein
VRKKMEKKKIKNKRERKKEICMTKKIAEKKVN